MAWGRKEARRSRYGGAVPSPLAHLPDNGPADGDGLPPVDIYKIAVDEYRFQATFNWSRTQYLLALNIAILAAGTVVASRPGHGATLVFALGAVIALLSLVVVRVQHSYYRAARAHLRTVETTLHVPEDQRLNTTATMGNRRRRIAVTQVVNIILVAIAVSDAVGFSLILTR